MVERESVVSGYVLDETVALSLDELSGVCQVRRAQIIELVEEGVIEPDARYREWRFTASTLGRVSRALRLQRDLDINAAGAALILDLLEEIRALRAHATGGGV